MAAEPLKPTVFPVRMEVDAMVPGALGGFPGVAAPFKLSVSATTLTFAPKCCGIACCGQPYTVSLSQVKLSKMVSVPYTAPGMVIQVEQERHVALGLKLWMDGGSKSLEECFDTIEAMRKLVIGQVLIAGSMEMSAAPSARAITYYPRDATRRIYELQTKLTTAKVDEMAKLGLGDDGGAVVLTRKTFGVEMVQEKPTADGGSEVCSVFCQAVIEPAIFLHTTTAAGPGGRPVFKIVIPGAAQTDVSNLRVEVPADVILAAPYEDVKNEGSVDYKPLSKGRLAAKSAAASVSAAGRYIKRSISTKGSNAAPPARAASLRTSGRASLPSFKES
jgi:hypothetical protein